MHQDMEDGEHTVYLGNSVESSLTGMKRVYSHWRVRNRSR